MTVKTKSENLLNYITGSAGGWPANTKVGILGNLDYLVETGSNDIYFIEMNTNISLDGSIAEQTSLFNKVSDYVDEQECDTCYVYGVHESFKSNPTSYQRNLISSSFARHDIPVSFEYQNSTSHTYFSQRTMQQYSGSFHLFLQSPYYSDDGIFSIVSGSYNKINFRSIVGSSPESNSLIPLFDSSSPSTNTNNPDFIVKNPSLDGGFINNYKMYDWNGSNTRVTDAITAANTAGHIVENFIVMSGSSENLEVGQFVYLTTSTKQLELKDTVVPLLSYKSDGDDGYTAKSYGRTTASGSLIGMFDGSTKQVQDIEVGDVVASYWPDGMSLSDVDYMDYTTTNLTGSMSGSIVIGITSDERTEHYLLNGTKILSKSSFMAGDSDYFVKSSGTWGWEKTRNISSGDYLLQGDGTELEVTSLIEKTGSMTFYSLDVEDIDTYFQSDILVHNLPKR